MKQIIPAIAFAAIPSTIMAQGNSKQGIDLSNLDTSVSPGESFYEYACGGWMRANPLPAAYARFGSFDQLDQKNEERINSILNGLLEQSFEQGTVEQKLSDYYRLAMDSTRRNNEGAAPLMPLIKEMEAAKSKEELRNLQLKYAHMAYGVPFSWGFGADEKDSRNNILGISQSGLTLGQKEYYIDTDSATTAIREAYIAHIARMFELFGFNTDEAKAKSTQIIKVETAIANVSKSRTELRDTEANYNKMTLEQFEEDCPNSGFSEFLAAQGINPEYTKIIDVGQPEFSKAADKIMAETTADELRAYMEWDAILSAANYLSDEIVDANFDFFGRTMAGRKENYPRWKLATNQVQGQMGESLGRIYVEKYFSAEAKERMRKLVANLQTSLGKRIEAQDWMSDITKKAALEKLATFKVKIGYPDKWRNIDNLTIDPSLSYYENAVNCRIFWKKWQIENRAGKPVDSDEWFMYPQTVNAYYNPTTNEICFPAGILQSPFFDMAADDAFNYGAIGVVIGHEMTHGFDDQGRHYDKDGNMTDWWEASDGEMFNERAESYADYFSSIEVLPGVFANGKLTLGENIADHGGLSVAFNAFKQAQEENPEGISDDTTGLTPEQRFFIAYAGVWAANITEEEIRNRTKSDPHALGRWRVDGALPHIDEWYDAFGITPSDKLYIPKDKRLKLW